MTAPVTCLRTMRTYAEQQSDLARRKRNRVSAMIYAGIIFSAVAGIVLIKLFGR